MTEKSQEDPQKIHEEEYEFIDKIDGKEIESFSIDTENARDRINEVF